MDIFGRSDKMMKINVKVDILKTQTMDSVQNISFFFIDRTFSTEKNRFFSEVY